MEQITNFENQSLNQNLNPVTPQKNIFKILFFILLALLLVVISVSATLLITKNKELVPIKETEISPTPTEAIKEETNILKISDIQMEFPKNWKVSSVSGDTAKILTDYPQYQVYLTLKLNKNDSIAESSYNSAGPMIKTQYGEVYEVQGGGPKGWTGALLNNNKYSFSWDIESNQPTPTNLDGIWRPNDNVTSEILLNITKTVRPLTEISTTTQDWKTYENKEIGFSFQYPVSYGEVTTNVSSGESGTLYKGVFSKNSNLVFGGISIDFSDGRGGRFTDFSGYLNKNNVITYYGARIYNKEFIIESKAIKKIYKNKNGLEIVLINGYMSEDNYPSPVGLGEGNIGALVNTNDKTYPGISFQFPKTLETELITILDSLKLTK